MKSGTLATSVSEANQSLFTPSAVTLSLGSSFSITKKCPMVICEIRVQGSVYTRREFKGAAAFSLLLALKPCASCCVLQSPHICQGPLAGNKSGPCPAGSHSWNKLTITSKTETDYSDIRVQVTTVYLFVVTDIIL